MALPCVVTILSPVYLAGVGVGDAIAYVLYGWLGVCLVGGLVGLVLRPFARHEDVSVERLSRVLKKHRNLVAAVWFSGCASVLLTFLLFVRVLHLRTLFAVPLGIVVGTFVGVILVYAAATGILEIEQGE
jgi:hypothetical protein